MLQLLLFIFAFFFLLYVLGFSFAAVVVRSSVMYREESGYSDNIEIGWKFSATDISKHKIKYSTEFNFKINMIFNWYHRTSIIFFGIKLGWLVHMMISKADVAKQSDDNKRIILKLWLSWTNRFFKRKKNDSIGFMQFLNRLN